MKKRFKNFLKWIFKEEIVEMKKKFDDEIAELNTFRNIIRHDVNELKQFVDVSIDVHEPHRPSKSWAVISIQGHKMDYIKFVDLGDMEIREIGGFLRQFERPFGRRHTIDARSDIKSFIFRDLEDDSRNRKR